MDLIKHIYEHFTRISLTYMAAHDERLRASYNSEEPLKSLTKRLNKCADFSTAVSDPVFYTQLVRIAYGLMVNTGQYPEHCRTWRNQDEK